MTFKIFQNKLKKQTTKFFNTKSAAQINVIKEFTQHG